MNIIKDLVLIKKLLIIYFSLGIVFSVLRAIGFDLRMIKFSSGFLVLYWLYDRLKVYTTVSENRQKIWHITWALLSLIVLYVTLIQYPILSTGSPDSESVLVNSLLADNTSFLYNIGFLSQYWGFNFAMLIYGYESFFAFSYNLIILLVILILFGSSLGGLINSKKFSSELLIYYLIILSMLVAPMLLRHLFSLQSNLMNAVLLLVIISEWKLYGRCTSNLAILLFYFAFWRLENPPLALLLIMLFWLDDIYKMERFDLMFALLLVGMFGNLVFSSYSEHPENHQSLLWVTLFTTLLTYIIYLLSKYSLVVTTKMKLVVDQIKKNIILLITLIIILLVSLDFTSWNSMVQNAFSYKAVRRSWGFVWYLIIGYVFSSVLFKLYSRKIIDKSNLNFKSLTGFFIPVVIFVYYMAVVLLRQSYRIDIGDSGNRLLIGVAFSAMAIFYYKIYLMEIDQKPHDSNQNNSLEPL